MGWACPCRLPRHLRQQQATGAQSAGSRALCCCMGVRVSHQHGHGAQARRGTPARRRRLTPALGQQRPAPPRPARPPSCSSAPPPASAARCCGRGMCRAPRRAVRPVRLAPLADGCMGADSSQGGCNHCRRSARRALSASTSSCATSTARSWHASAPPSPRTMPCECTAACGWALAGDPPTTRPRSVQRRRCRLWVPPPPPASMCTCPACMPWD